MTDVEIFQTPAGHEVRTVLRDGDPWFVAGDVCRVLGIANSLDAISTLDADEKGVVSTDTPGGPQRVRIVSESGLYSLILRSRKAEAKTFKRWVTHEVLPAIRKTGQYAAVRQISRRELAQLVIEEADRADRAEAKVVELEPMAEQAARHRAADGLIAVGDFANKLKGWAKTEHGVRIKHTDVWDFLGQIGLLIRGNTVRNNQPTAFATERDFVRVKETEYETNSSGTQVSTSPRLTPAGEGWAWDRAVRRIVAHGSLKPTKSLEKKAS